MNDEFHFRIPQEKIQEWSLCYQELIHNNPELLLNENMTRDDYIAHCGALWGYTKGVLAIKAWDDQTEGPNELV